MSRLMSTKVIYRIIIDYHEISVSAHFFQMQTIHKKLNIRYNNMMEAKKFKCFLYVYIYIFKYVYKKCLLYF